MSSNNNSYEKIIFTKKKQFFLYDVENVILEFKERHVGILIPMGLEQNPGSYRKS